MKDWYRIVKIAKSLLNRQKRGTLGNMRIYCNEGEFFIGADPDYLRRLTLDQAEYLSKGASVESCLKFRRITRQSWQSRRREYLLEKRGSR